MSLKKAQKIAEDVNNEIGFNLVKLPVADLQYLKDKLEDFLELEVETEDLVDPDEPNDDNFLDEVSDDEEEEEV